MRSRQSGDLGLMAWHLSTLVWSPASADQRVWHFDAEGDTRRISVCALVMILVAMEMRSFPKAAVSGYAR